METLTELLQRRAREQGSSTGYIFLDDEGKEIVRLTYAELHRQALRIAATIRVHLKPGDRVLMLYPPGPEFVSAFFACLYAGIIAVPAYPPKRNQKLNRLLTIASDARVRAALTTEVIADRFKSQVDELPAQFRIDVFATDALARGADTLDAFTPHAPQAKDIAFLQYTSGSTGTPKGVMVTHGNLLHNERVISEAFRVTPQSVGCGWLPMFHDMGLVGTLLNPLFSAVPVVLLPPLAFMKRPLLWLKAMSDYRATHSGGPNFAYEMCVRQIKPEERDSLDLSRWTLAFCGAEPVRADTLRRFSEYFAPAGFRAEAFSPCYGLAESTLFVTGGATTPSERVLDVDRRELQSGRVTKVPGSGAASDLESQTIVSCGRTFGGMDVRIVDPATRRVCAPDAVGEIWVAGASVAKGYFRDPETTREVFQAHTSSGEGPYLRTGDLGFLERGQLFVTGRIKDIVIIRGRNYYPQDIEASVEGCHPTIQPARSVAFAIERDGQDQLVVAAEIDRSAVRTLDVPAVTAAVRRAVVQNLELAPSVVALLKPGGLPRTSSGKIQRGACRDSFLAGQLDMLGMWRADSPSPSSHPPGLPQVDVVVDWIVQWLSRELKVDPASIDANRPLLDHGLDSRAGVELILALEGWLGVTIQPELLWEAPSIVALVSYLLGEDELEGITGGERRKPWPSCPPVSASISIPRAAESDAARTRSSQTSFEFSLFFFATDQGAEQDKYRLILESAKFADAHGFSGIWTPERHFHAFGGLFPNPAVLGAALARETQRIRIRAGSVVVPLNHPVRIAEEWAVVDNLSGGRVDIGFSSGWNPNDFLLNPGAYEDRRRITTDGMATVRRLWRGGTYIATNARGESIEVQTYPRPLQPEVPVWLTCTRDAEGFVHAGASGANLLTALLLQTPEELAERIADYRRARAEHGLDPDTGRVTLMLHTFLGDDTRTVKELVRPYLTEYLRSSVTLWRQGSERLNELSEREHQRLPDLAFERYFRTSSLLGTVDDARETVRRLRAIGVDEIACLVDFGLPTDTVLGGLRQIARLQQLVNTARPAAALGSSVEASPSAERPLVLRDEPRPRASLRLFCFPYAGGDISAFKGWSQSLPPSVEVCLVDAPQSYEHMDRLLDALVPALIPYLDVPFAFYGHSVGALIAFETARRLRDRHGKEPIHLFVAAQHAPQSPFPYPTYDQLQTPAGAALLELGFPVPKSVPPAEAPQYRQRLLQSLKPGMLIQSTNYSYEAGRPFTCPLTVFGGANDRMVHPRQLEEWQQHTSSGFDIEMLPGGHLFLHKYKTELLQRLAALLDFLRSERQEQAQ